MIAFPNAKINLGLYVTGKRTDGYHDIRSLIYPLPFYDILEIVPAKKRTVINFSGRTIPGPASQNLVLKAFYLLKEKYDIPPVEIHLHKVIPTGSGLGGGSSDAVSALKLLADLFKIPAEKGVMAEMAGNLGSDCSFFLENRPAFVSGRGDRLQHTDFSLSGYYCLLFKPGQSISTGDAYGGVKLSEPPEEFRSIGSYGPEHWKAWLKNCFEDHIFEKHPEIRYVKEGLYASGALYASMTGSGSAVFGIFKEEPAQVPAFDDVELLWKGRF